MASLALLYPAFVDNSDVFRCPSTSDQAEIQVLWTHRNRQVSFGRFEAVEDDIDLDDSDGDGLIDVEPNYYVGEEVETAYKSSYMYDEKTHFRDVGPNQAIAADADGYTWRMGDGQRANYDTDDTADANNSDAIWVRSPRRPNHVDGQNVMYFDGHVDWADNNYASDTPQDNIYCPNGTSPLGEDQWGKDTDAFLWDGANDPVQLTPLDKDGNPVPFEFNG
jgi:prepilin-type processing-associated H-X9-DG protein